MRKILMLVAVLVIAAGSVWLLNSMSQKSPSSQDEHVGLDENSTVLEENKENEQTNPPATNVKKETNKKSGQETQNKTAENIEELRENAIELLNTLSEDCPSLEDQKPQQLAKIEEATSREELEICTSYMNEICL